MDLKNFITDVPDYPKEGIIFKDITTLWQDARALKNSIDELVNHYKDKKIDKIVAAEARGFIIGVPMALLGAFVFHLPEQILAEHKS